MAKENTASRPKLTAAQTAEYVRIGGIRCPFCDSDDISCGRIEPEASGAYANCSCDTCHEEWIDEYKLVGVEPAEELTQS